MMRMFGRLTYQNCYRSLSIRFEDHVEKFQQRFDQDQKCSLILQQESAFKTTNKAQGSIK